MAYKSSLRGARPVTLICIHTAEGARTAPSLAAYFYRSDIQASSHSIVDAYRTINIVPWHRAAWTLRSGNPISDNLEICGFAGWTRAEWLSTGTVDGCVNPRLMLSRVAVWIRQRCQARNIPIRRLSLAQVRQGARGVIHHYDWTQAMRDGTHWDVGPGFPWDVVMAEALGSSAGGGQEDEVSWTEKLEATDPKNPKRELEQTARQWLTNGMYRLERIEHQQKIMRSMVVELLKNTGGFTLEQVEAAARRGTLSAMMDGADELAVVLGRHLSHELSAEAVKEALREVFGDLDEQDATA